MDIGKRLRELREAKRLSLGDIERRSGLLRSYISRVEGGYTAPSLSALEKFAKALEVEPYQLLFSGEGRPTAPTPPGKPGLSRALKRLVSVVGPRGTVPSDDANLVFASLARVFCKL